MSAMGRGYMPESPSFPASRVQRGHFPAREVRRECACCAAPPFPRAPQHVFDVHAYACVCMCRGRQWHPAARMRACMMQREQQGSPRARAGQGRVMHAHTCTDVRATVGCAHGYLGLPACMACMRVSGTLCLSCVRAQRAGTYTHTRTHTYMRSISREGGGDHSLHRCRSSCRPA